jgi:hypothetical protein
MNAACGEAKAQGLRTMVHAHSIESIKRTVMGGCNQVEHGSYADAETMKLMADKGVWFDPNIGLVIQNYLENKAHFLGIGNYNEEGFAYMQKALPLMNDVLQRIRPGGDEALYGDSFNLGPAETLHDVLRDNEQCGRETAAIIADIADLSQPVLVPKDVPWFPKDVESWEVRWVLLHLIEEIARHAGHADIIREHIDGGQMYPIMAAAEHRPESPWMQPWKPTGDQVMPSTDA